MVAKEPMIARRAAQWLGDQGLEVYQEVRVAYADRIADLVGAGAEALVVVECKTHLGLDVIEQAEYWLPECNASWIAFADIRSRRRGYGGRPPRTRRLALKFCKWLGIGVLAIPEGEADPPEILVPAQIHPTEPFMDRLRERLVPEQRVGAGYAEAGTRNAGIWTVFRDTADLVTEIVAEHPNGADIDTVLAEVDARGGHHYQSDRSFRSNMLKQIRRGTVPGVKVSKASKAFGRRPTVLVPTERSESNV